MISSICASLPRENTVAGKSVSKGWATATWKGSREAQLRAALTLTLRQRFQALEELALLAQRLASMPSTTATTARPAKKR